MRLDDVLDDAQAEAAAVVRTREMLIDLVEAVEHFADSPRREADAVVGDGDHDPAAAAPGGDCDVAAARRNTSRRCRAD